MHFEMSLVRHLIINGIKSVFTYNRQTTAHHCRTIGIYFEMSLGKYIIINDNVSIYLN
jgi:hypothetical protein